MSSLIAACALFLGLHWIVSGSPLRNVIVSRIYERSFKKIFSLSVLASIIWMSMAYANAPYIETWGVVASLKPIAMVLMLFAFIFLIFGIFTRDPQSLDRYTPENVQVHGIFRITRNPALIGFGLWGLAHFIVRGDWASHALFGTFAFQGLIAPMHMERKHRKRFGKVWDAFVKQTSHWPFVAIFSGSNQLKLALVEINWGLIIISILIYAMVLVSHEYWFGVSLFS